ncbi:C-type lectin domain family 9 member A isoform X2 [Bos taurus]|uniref:C-type lectin domain family 9 member A isoform X2 n=1 Tax=Bos taurus TaxID=9913 RepID=UPI0028CB953A|nr:C-type lectin domain family 9 member A-like isoform X2 [Bos taurus]
MDYIVHGIANGRTQLRYFHFTSIMYSKSFPGWISRASIGQWNTKNSASKIMTFKEKPLNIGKECKSKWSCCGQRSYYISDELKNFEESKKSCKEMDSTLLKIEDKEELSFIQSRLSYFYWIGLSRKGTRNQWTWEDNSLPFLKSDWNESNEGNCAYIKATKMSASDCSRFRCFIFEKRNIDNLRYGDDTTLWQKVMKN